MATITEPTTGQVVDRDDARFLHLYQRDPQPGDEAICGHVHRIEDRNNGATERCPQCALLGGLQ